MIDSHCHLDHEPLFKNISKIIERSKDEGIKKLLTICTSIESFENIIKIISIDDIIYGTFGIHPHETDKNKVSKNLIIKNIKKNKKLIGIGETGLDFYYNNSEKKIQKEIFIEHINAATELDLPLIVHSRNAEKDTFDILKSEKKNNNLKVLIHCFTGSKDFAKKLIDINCYISLSGIITFSNSNELIETVSTIPLDNLLVETDSPYLSPVPFRGQSNEPSYIKYTVEKLSKIKKTTVTEVEEKTSSNFLKIFNLS